MEDYNNLVKPLVAARPDVFGDASYYSEDRYNRMGSLILSRSFHVEEAGEADGESVDGQENADTSAMSLASIKGDASMGDDSDGALLVDEGNEGVLDSDDEDDEEDVRHIAMVPWADMLNARHGCDNARLFYEKDCLNMVSTKAIAKGEQIWNVYGDPPNSDLLRRYGHVDVHNPSDIVEITADLVADVVCRDKREERIEFLLEADIDE
jgi:SET domain-containing protein 6